MTYFGFLLIFLGIPIAVLSLLTVIDYRRGLWLPKQILSYPAWAVMVGLCLVAFIWTTPWDNYLVATNVWWYDPALVNGLVIGYVPIEEYTFFLVQPVMTSLFLLALLRYLPQNADFEANTRLNVVAGTLSAVFCIFWCGMLLLAKQNTAYQGFTYLALELSWAFVPITLQLFFGADILWHHRWNILIAIGISTVYLSWADSLAIGSGTWTIDPAQSLNIYLGGVLPIEELIFFLITNTLVVFGMVLVLAQASQARAQSLGRIGLLKPALDWLERHQLKTTSY